MPTSPQLMAVASDGSMRSSIAATGLGLVHHQSSQEYINPGASSSSSGAGAGSNQYYHNSGSSSSSKRSRLRPRHASQDANILRPAISEVGNTPYNDLSSAAASVEYTLSPSPLPALHELFKQLDDAKKTRDGAESFLELLSSDRLAASSKSLPSPGAAAALRARVEAELYSAQDRISDLQAKIEAISRSPLAAIPPPDVYADTIAFSSPAFSAAPLPLGSVSPGSAPPLPLQPSSQASQTESLVDPPESVPAQVHPEDPATISSISYLLDNLFNVLRRSTLLRHAFLGKAVSIPNYMPTKSAPLPNDVNDGALDNTGDPYDDASLGSDPFLDTLIHLLADTVGQELHAKTYRLLAQLLVEPSTPFLARCRARGFDTYLSRTLTRDTKSDAERVEALRFIRKATDLSGQTRTKDWSNSSSSSPSASDDEDDDDGYAEAKQRSDRQAKRQTFSTSKTDALQPDEPESWLRPKREVGEQADLPFSPAVIRVLAAGVNDEKDRLRWVFLETLAELREGLGVLVNALRSGPPEYAPSLVQIFLFLLDVPSTRQYLRPGLDLDIVLSPITDVPFRKSSIYEAEVRAGVKTISVILRSWSGLIYLCMDERRSINNIVKALVAGTQESKESIMLMLGDIFELAQRRIHPESTGTGRALRHLDSQTMMRTMVAAAATSPPSKSVPLPATAGPDLRGPAPREPQWKVVADSARPSLLEQYASLLLAIFVEAGIIDALVHIIEALPGPLVNPDPIAVQDGNEATARSARVLTTMFPTADEVEAVEQRKTGEVGRRAVRLLGTIMQIARRLLPANEAVSVQSVPRLFALAAHFRPTGAERKKGKRSSPDTKRTQHLAPTSEYSAAGRGLASSALSAIDLMDQPSGTRFTTTTQPVIDFRTTRLSSDTITPGLTGPSSSNIVSSPPRAGLDRTVTPLATGGSLSSATGDTSVPSSRRIENNQQGPTESLASVATDEGSRRTQQRNVELARLRAGLLMDDGIFRSLLLESQVLTYKDHTKWNLNAITELLEGPLLNSRRLEDVARGSKFVRRLLSFFHPSEQRFANLANTSANRKYVKLGCSVMRAFSATPDGVKILAEDLLLREIRQALDQLDPVNFLSSGAGPLMPAGDQLMSKIRVQETLTFGYFEMIGTLTRSAEGIELLQRVQMFTVLYNLSAVPSRDYLIREVIKHFDYSIDGHTRFILSKVLTCPYRSMRVFATRTLTGLIAQTDEPSQWLIALLLTQLYDTAHEVRELAVRTVMLACRSPAVLELVVSMRPTLEHLGDISHPLLLRFMSSSNGFRYLLKNDYINQEMEDWFNVRNLRYAVRLERVLAGALSIDNVSEEALFQQQTANRTSSEGYTLSSRRASAPASDPLLSVAAAGDSYDGTVPPHFYGELAKTAEGCAALKQKGHFGEFAAYLRRHAKECEDTDVIARLKSVLWTVGNIGATPRGLSFLEAEDVISTVVEIAEQSAVLSVRGVAFFVIGMIASTQQGAEVLLDYGWRTAWTPMGLPTGVSIPVDLDAFLGIEPWTAMPRRKRPVSNLLPSQDPLERTILTALSELGNSIVAKLAHKELIKLKACYPEYFENDFQSGLAANLKTEQYPSGGLDANMTPTIGSMEERLSGLSTESQTAQAEPLMTNKRLLILARAFELLDNFPLPTSMRRVVWDLFDVTLDDNFIKALALVRKGLEQQQRKWMEETATRSRLMQDGVGGSETATLSGSWLRARSHSGPGPGTAAYGAAVGLRTVAGALHPQHNQEHRYGQNGTRTGPVGFGASFHHPGGEVGSIYATGLDANRMRMMAEEDEDDSDEDSDVDDSTSGVRAGTLGTGPAVFVSRATYTSDVLRK
ncbi:hypothetical protein OC846_002598 [Tilletia horrida]|uniref:REM-1 domain-containing protein n=1 Tax=Tilletia horrida TaxID=155126 RepID=A0AAN6JSH4_9BASI|nr:hypothetical protein OC845_002869 [Tilletia horrida]KAK0553226.1 hypothetical protein OC846_002598 [Tilletia horrida]